MSPELEQIRRKAEGITSALPPSAWHQVRPGEWSGAEILEHLRLSYVATTSAALQAMEVGKPLGRKPTLKQRLSVFYVVGLGLFPAGRQAPEHSIPTHSGGVDSLRHFNDALVAMDATLADAEKRFGKQVRLLEHPVLGPVTAQQMRRFHRTHSLHHLKRMARRKADAKGLAA